MDLLEKLAKPFHPSLIHWRAQSISGDKKTALALAYVDARDVARRLDNVCGAEWQRDHRVVGSKTFCGIGIKVNGEWIWRWDGAGDTNVEGDKGAFSDSFKRAAVSWGIARYLYDMDAGWVACETTTTGKFRHFTQNPWDNATPIFDRDKPVGAGSFKDVPWRDLGDNDINKIIAHFEEEKNTSSYVYTFAVRELDERDIDYQNNMEDE